MQENNSEVYRLFELDYPSSSGNNSSQVGLGSDCYPQSELLDILFLVTIQTFTFTWTSTLIKKTTSIEKTDSLET